MAVLCGGGWGGGCWCITTIDRVYIALVSTLARGGGGGGDVGVLLLLIAFI